MKIRDLIAIGLVLIILYLLLFPVEKEKILTEVKIDTITVTKEIVKTNISYHTDTIIIPGDTVFIPSESYEELLVQFNQLAKDYSVRNIYKDTIQIDTIGFIYLQDTIQYNLIKSRSYKYDYTRFHYTLPETKNNLYIGISGNNNFAGVGLTIKSKKENLYSLHYNTNSTFTFSLHKKL